MNTLEEILPSKLFEILDRNHISTPKQVILLSSWDIKKLTNLSTEDIRLIKNIVSKHSQPQCLSCDKLLSLESQSTNGKVRTGCSGIDHLLNGGFRRGTITEIYGESGSGKTQIGLQATACNWALGCVYICTEDLFPIKRYEQIKMHSSNYCSNKDYGKNTFIEHITESDDLLLCVRVRLAKLLSHNQISLVVIDSVAAPFRVDSINYVHRAEELRELANLLIHTAQVHNLAILCINQVTAAFNDSPEDVIPSLGLAWSNMICTRLWLKKTNITYLIPENKSRDAHHVNVRELSLKFAPDLLLSTTRLVITPTGIHEI